MTKWKRIFKYTLLAAAIVYLSADAYIYYSYKRLRFPETYPKALERYAKINADSIPGNIVRAYERVFPGTLSSRFYPDLCWLLITRLQEKRYIQLDLAYDIAHDSGLPIFSLANQLDNHLTREQCVYAYLSEIDYDHFIKGPDSAATVYYHKPLETLNERECLELVIMSENPSLYDKMRSQARLDAEVKRYLP